MKLRGSVQQFVEENLLAKQRFSLFKQSLNYSLEKEILEK